MQKRQRRIRTITLQGAIEKSLILLFQYGKINNLNALILFRSNWGYNYWPKNVDQSAIG